MSTIASLKYDTYRESGVAWYGDVPSHWLTRRVKDELLSLDHKRVPLNGEVRQNMASPKYDYYGASGVIDKVDDYIFDEPLILLGEDGANLLMRSSPLAFIAEGKFWVNNHAHVLKPRTGDLRFFCYLLESIDYTTMVSGSAQPKLTAGQLGLLVLMIPPVSEQKTIAAYLNEKTAQIDRRIDLLSKKKEKYLELKQALISNIVAHGLDKTAPMKDSGIEWMGDVPAHWQALRVSDISREQKRSNAGLVEKNLLSLSYGNIVRKNIDTNFGLLPESFETYQIVHPGNIILRLTDLQNDWKSLRVGLVKERGIITSAYLCLRLSREIHPPFAYYLLHVYDIRKVFYRLGGGLRQSMKWNDVKVLPFYRPSLPEQEAIADYLDTKTAQIDRIVETINTQIDKLTELRKALINDVVTGRIRVV